MKALILENYQNLPQIKNIPIPSLKKNEVLVKVAYCGINRVDLAVLSGRFKNTIPFPLIMGSEIVGTLPNGKKVAVNPYLYCGKCRFCKKKEYLVCEKGRPLLGVQKNGGYAEYVAVPKKNIVFMPEGISFKNAAAVTLSGGTAYRMVFTKGKIQKDNWVVVTAAGGGVGVYACQFTKLKKAKLIAFAGSDFKLTKLKTLGIKNLINYTNNNWIEKLLEITKNRGVDIVIDTIGGSVLEKLIPYVASLGKIITCGATENPKISLNLINLYMKQIEIRGSSGFTNEDLTKIFQLVKNGKIKPIIDSVYSLQEVPKAWEKLKSRQVFGKILVKIS